MSLSFLPTSKITATFFLALATTLSTSALADPTVTVQNAPSNTPAQPQDPQVAPTPTSPFNHNSQTGTPSNTNTPDALANANSLANDMQPSAAELSEANQKLLTRNAKLQRDVNDLETRVNVLINERSGQLFMYGAITVIISLLVGFFLGWVFFNRRERW